MASQVRHKNALAPAQSKELLSVSADLQVARARQRAGVQECAGPGNVARPRRLAGGDEQARQ